MAQAALLPYKVERRRTKRWRTETEREEREEREERGWRGGKDW